MNVFAVFVLCQNDNGIAMTTRPDGRIGLPGGKVDQGEDIATAALREAFEEGWNVSLVSNLPIHSQLVDGKLCVWLAGTIISKLENYKEKYRGIIPFYGTKEILRNSGMGNEVVANLI